VYDLKKLHPVQTGNLIRLGRDWDGGYVIAKEQAQKTEVLLSFGINDDWSFEIDFEKQKHIKMLAFDYSVSLRGVLEKTREHIGYALGGLLILKRSWIISACRNIKSMLKNVKEIKKYFARKQDRYFIPKYLNVYNDAKNITLDSIFETLAGIKNLSVFIKMDIEGAEYAILPRLSPYFDKINGIAIEFHDLHKKNSLDAFNKATALLLDHFEIIHIHGNTVGGTVLNTLLPAALELTFMHKEMLPKNPAKSTAKYPINGLDFPNGEDDSEDYILPYNYADDIDSIVAPYRQDNG
jgi:hypothetical protein